MSGGSFDYLYSKEPGALVTYELGESQIDAMRNELAAYGADDAARELEEVVLIARQARVRLETRWQRLTPVMKAVEWWRSCDSSRSAVDDALAEYRADAPPQHHPV